MANLAVSNFPRTGPALLTDLLGGSRAPHAAGDDLKLTVADILAVIATYIGILKTSGNPEGVLVCPTTAGLAYDPATQGLWGFNGVAGTNTGWVAIVSPP